MTEEVVLVKIDPSAKTIGIDVLNLLTI